MYKVGLEIFDTAQIRLDDSEMQAEVLNNLLCGVLVATGKNSAPLHQPWEVPAQNPLNGIG